ncbi:MAG TPA: permease prefix domain 1-containing protein [Pirellulaceae bacterium]|nr:permease prefix domain 1-containing protein [Pirellulaceae bacterium]
MSQQEFETYLALLTRLLRVAPQQRDQLAEEFRAHLEDRLDELLAGGMAKDKAVQQAIGEFGDAAILAAELAAVANRKRRRIIMRVSLASAATLAAALLLALALWPDGRQVQGPAAAVAQTEGDAAVAAAQPAAVPDKIAQAHQKIQAALDREVEFDFLDLPLTEVAEHIAKTNGFPVILATSTLADAAITEDTPVTNRIKGISLRSALRLMLGELNLTYVIENEVLAITTPEDADLRLVTRVYDVRELLAMETPPGSIPALKPKADEKPSSGESGDKPPAKEAPSGGFGSKRPELSDADRLINLITTVCEPDSWDYVGGPGTADEYKGLITISQTREIHEEVERLLNMLHRAAGLKEQRVKVVE